MFVKIYGGHCQPCINHGLITWTEAFSFISSSSNSIKESLHQIVSSNRKMWLLITCVIGWYRQQQHRNAERFPWPLGHRRQQTISKGEHNILWSNNTHVSKQQAAAAAAVWMNYVKHHVFWSWKRSIIIIINTTTTTCHQPRDGMLMPQSWTTSMTRR